MKYAFASVLTILGAFAAGSALAASPAKLAELNQSIEQVFDTPGYDKAQIYDAAKVWIAENFRSAKAVMEYDNKEEGTLIGNGLIPYPCKGAFDCLAKPDWKVRFTMRVDTKDGRFRLTFSNIGLVWPAAVYNGVASRANDGSPLNSQKDRDKISVALLDFGPQIQAALGKAKSDENW
ncbi:DUF4468 domain-containing protein [Pseudoxanthomonas japonensis]|uniref:DUF4468 domain-containing protein n=1 Tax=Pseudoxanthomonas japonensis TaxID=69284 RepID=UPI001BD14791|nr:DUF4468 domain-containing protein [Pseudoxanthomonas japonensis]